MAIRPSAHGGRQEFQGKAFADKEQNSRTLLVMVPALMPMLQGKMQASEVTTDIKVGSTTGSVKTKNFIKAIWSEEGAPGMSCPDVRKDENVIVWNEGDNIDKWYWRSENRDNAKRKTETVRLSANATLDNDAELNDSNTYVFEMDSRRGHHIVLRTSQADGEAYLYTLNMDADKNQVSLSDNEDNTFFIDSKNTIVGLRNHDESSIIMNKKSISIACEENITLQTKQGQITLNAEGNLNLLTNSQLNLSSKGGCISECNGADMTLSANKFTFKRG